MTRDKLKLVANVALVIELEDMGVETNSRFHDDVEYRYNCSHRGSASMLYLKVDGHLAVKRSGARIGDEIEITKTLRNGAPVFAVRRSSDAQEPVATRPTVTMMAPQTQRVPAPAPAVAAAPLAVVHPLQEVMTRCLEVGYHANVAAYNNLIAQGIEIDAPIWEDVRATGISFFIERMKREGGR